MNRRQKKSTNKTYESPFKRRRPLRSFVLDNKGALVLAAFGILTFVLMFFGKSREIVVDEPKPRVLQSIRVIDGDTIDLDGARIRLFGIDAPERAQPCLRNGQTYNCGAASSEYLKFLLVGEHITCETESTDRWGRAVATCLINDVDVSQQMVKSGWAIAYVEYSKRYVDHEEFARSNGLGMWAKDFELPKDWRSRKRK